MSMAVSENLIRIYLKTPDFTVFLSMKTHIRYSSAILLKIMIYGICLTEILKSMKKRSSNIILKSTVVVTLAALISIITGINSNRKGIVENAAALELLSSRSRCFNQYEVNEKERCLICISCTYANGSGLTIGGYCKIDRPSAGQ